MISVHNALVVMTPSGCGFQLINSNYFIQSTLSSGVSSHLSGQLVLQWRHHHPTLPEALLHMARCSSTLPVRTGGSGVFSSPHTGTDRTRCFVALGFQTCAVLRVPVM